MKKIISILSVVILSASSFTLYAQATISNKEEQIKTALLAAPEEARDGAHVYGFDETGAFITLRQGTNDFICIADDPNRNGFEVVSYHKSLEPFMNRGRQLRAEGKTSGERSRIRETEANNGTLKMPEKPATLHIYYGQEVTYNAEKDALSGAAYRYVVYIPYATQASTGLSLKPNGPGHPWLMFPGQYNAHIMITPPRPSSN